MPVVVVATMTVKPESVDTARDILTKELPHEKRKGGFPRALLMLGLTSKPIGSAFA